LINLSSSLNSGDEVTVLAWSEISVGNISVTDNDVAIGANISTSKLLFAPYSGSSRVVEDKLEDYLNIKDFGANGNGGDDTVAVQAAVNKAVQLGKALYVPSGNYAVNGITISGGILIFGDGSEKSVFSAGPAIGQKNIFSFSNATGVTLLDCGFDGRNDVRTGVFPPASYELGQYNLFFDGGDSIHIERCRFVRGVNRLIQFNSPSSTIDTITILNSHLEGAANGGVSVARNARKISICNNTFRNVVDSSIGGTSFEKSISIQGSTEIVLRENSIVSTNGDGCSIITEIPSSGAQTRCKEIVIESNYVKGSGENGIKVGSSDNIVVSKNFITNCQSSGIRVEGCTNVSVDSNFVSGSGGNAISIYEESYGLTPGSYRVSVTNNVLRNSNTSGATLGTPVPTPTIGAVGSYHLWCRTSEDVDVIKNTFLDDSTSQAGAILMQLNGRFRVKDNNLLGMKPGSVSIYTNIASASNSFEVSGNSGMRTKDSGVVTLSSGSSSVTVTPNVITNSNAFITIAPLSALSGSVAYTNISLGSSPSFAVQTRDSSHTLTPVSSNTQFAWSLETSKPIGVFGLTSN